MIDKFRRTTYKFEKKMGIFLNETYFKNKIQKEERQRKCCEEKSKNKKR